MTQTADLDDLLSEEAIDRPISFYAKLRERGAAHWNPRWNGWVVSSYDAVVAGFRDTAHLSADRFSGPFGADLRAGAAERPQLLNFLSKFFVWKDPPSHTRMRLLVNSAFTPKSVEAFRPRVRALVRELADPLAGRDADFLGEFAFHLPVIVIAEFLGVPSEARQQVRQWSEDLGAVIFVRGGDSARAERGERAMADIVGFLRPIVRARRAEPKDDFLTALAHAEADGARLDEDEVIANAVLMVFAGHETTMNLLANGIVAFHQFPEQWERLRAEPALARTAVEEILRFDGPIRGMARWAKAPLELGGQAIAANDRVFLVQHAANHDPAAFDNPDRLDIARWPNRHVAFGQGIHTCLGAPLARMEAQEAIAYLAEQFAQIEVLEPALRYAPTLVSRSLKSLKTRMHEA
ncbi:MAG: cytochrome P450 [Hyphomonadaceae bacterium]